WAWDAVENAALMPWLIGTAFLHSVMVQEKRGMLKVWNASLIAATFVLSLLGTFLVRSGVLDSIHAFGASTLGAPFLVFIGIVAMLAWRRGTPAGFARLFAFPLFAAGIALAVMLGVTPAAESVTSLIMFTFIAFVFAVIGQEFWRGARARRVTTRESWPVALV